MSVRARFYVFALALVSMLGVTRAHAQLVPASSSAPGAMSAGCPADWEHRDAGVGSFSCRDADTGEYCGMRAPSASDALSTARSLDDAAGSVRRWLAAQGGLLLGERREGRAHLFWLELRGERLALIVVPDRIGYAQVNCGAGTGDLNALLATFVDIATSARR